MTSLALDNKTLVVKLQQTEKAPFVVPNHLHRENGEKHLFAEHVKTQISAAGPKVGPS